MSVVCWVCPVCGFDRNDETTDLRRIRELESSNAGINLRNQELDAYAKKLLAQNRKRYKALAAIMKTARNLWESKHENHAGFDELESVMFAHEVMIYDD